MSDPWRGYWPAECEPPGERAGTTVRLIVWVGVVLFAVAFWGCVGVVAWDLAR